METSDDPILKFGVVGGDIYEGITRRPKVDVPPKPKDIVAAEPQEQLDKKKRRMASVLTRDWAAPSLGQPALLGM